MPQQVLAPEEEGQGEYPSAGTVALLLVGSNQTQELARAVLRKARRRATIVGEDRILVGLRSNGKSNEERFKNVTSE